MATEPSEEGIRTVAAVTGLAAAEAAKWLKAYNCDPQKASNAYYDNNFVLPESNGQNGWGEPQLDADNVGARHQPSFTVHRSDTLAPNAFSDSAPSRPPSRMSAKGTVMVAHDREADLTKLGTRSNLTLAEQENEDISQAMSRSMNDNHGLSDQETGVIDGLEPHFGPATRGHYDTKDWAMTIPDSCVQEILQNPDAVDRKRAGNSPAFLKPSLTGHQLPALVTILHAIPMAREALLNSNHILPNYGFNAEWWDGVPTSIGSFAVIESAQEDRESNLNKLIYEFQRLMAFLDETERAYGSSEVLSQLQCLGDRSDIGSLGDVLEKWAKATRTADPNGPYLNIFQSEAMRVDLESEPECRPFSCLELQVMGPSDPVLFRARTLYDLIDYALWSSVQDCTSELAFLNTIGEVFCIQLTGTGRPNTSGLNIKVPSVLFLDRYLEESKRQIQDMLQAQRALESGVNRIEHLKAGITTVKSPAGDTSYSLPALVATAIAYYDEKNISPKGSPRKSEADNKQRVLKDLQDLAANIDEKLQMLDRSRQEAIERYAEISQWYTRPSEKSGQPPFHKYTLRGVATTDNTTYVLARNRGLGSGHPVDDHAEEWQWWKLSFSQRQAQPVSQTRIREIEVLKAAKTEPSSTLLVYASESAVASEVSDLPPQLRDFIHADNLNFASELDKCESAKATTPTKRKADDIDGGELSVQHQDISGDTDISKDIVEDQPIAQSPPEYSRNGHSPPQSGQAVDVIKTRKRGDTVPIERDGDLDDDEVDT